MYRSPPSGPRGLRGVDGPANGLVVGDCVPLRAPPRVAQSGSGRLSTFSFKHFFIVISRVLLALGGWSLQGACRRRPVPFCSAGGAADAAGAVWSRMNEREMSLSARGRRPSPHGGRGMCLRASCHVVCSEKHSYRLSMYMSLLPRLPRRAGDGRRAQTRARAERSHPLCISGGLPGQLQVSPAARGHSRPI